EARVDEERAAGSERHLGVLEPEGILEQRARLAERVAAARKRAQHVASVQAPAGTPERDAPLAEPSHLFGEDDRGQEDVTLRLKLDVDAQVFALELLVRARRPH